MKQAHMFRSSLGAMSGGVGDDRSVHKYVLYNFQQLDVFGWSFKPFVKFNFSFNNVFVHLTVS